MLEAQAAGRHMRAPGCRMSAWRSEGGRRGGRGRGRIIAESTAPFEICVARGGVGVCARFAAGGYAARDRLSVLVRDFGCRLRDVAQQGQRLPFHRSRVMQVEQYE